MSVLRRRERIAHLCAGFPVATLLKS